MSDTCVQCGRPLAHHPTTASHPEGHSYGWAWCEVAKLREQLTREREVRRQLLAAGRFPAHYLEEDIGRLGEDEVTEGYARELRKWTIALAASRAMDEEEK